MNVLVTGAGALLGQGVIKSLKLAKAGYHIIAADPDPRAVGLFWADTAYVIPLASSPDYLDSLSKILDRERPDAVVLGTDVELMAWSLSKDEMESRFDTHVIVSPPEVIQIANDKWRTYQFFRSHGFPHPRSTMPEDIDSLLRECDFPLVVKPRIGARSVGVRLVYNREELRVALATTVEPVIQECVATASDEFTSGILVTEEGVHAVVTMRRDLRDGNTYRAYVEPGSPFNAYLSEVATALKGWGPLNFQFRVDKGVPKIFEINARFSGTTPMRAYAGFNEVDHFLRFVCRGEPIPAPSLRNIVVLRFWDEIVVESSALKKISHGDRTADLSFERPLGS